MNGYYINLVHRTYRNKHFKENIQKYDFFKNLERFDAIYDEDCGEIGCVKSHINALSLCLDTNDDYYLIMEDDFNIIDEQNLLNFLNSFDKIKNKDWDIITLTSCGDCIFEDCINNFIRIKNTMSTTGYIIKRNIIRDLINNFTESLTLLVLNNDLDNYKLDKYWFGLQEKKKFYFYKEKFASQLIGYSDISKEIVIQDKLFVKEINYKSNLNEYLVIFINEPYNDINNFNLAFEYEEIEHTAAALSYYLRCSEFTKDNDLAYECLLRMSKCLSKQGNRDNKELTCIEHAISINPNRPEAYYIMSLYHSYRTDFLKSYMYACIGLENLSDKKLIKDIGFFHKYQLLFQKAYSGYNKGKISESKDIYYSLLNDYDINEFYEEIVNNNLNKYPEPNHKPIQYKKEKYDKIRYKFNNLENIEKNYSQIYQDMFVLSMHNGKQQGTYIEIGSGDPIYGNNTYLLETKFNWKGISIDINKDFCNSFKQKRNNECLNVNALEYDYNDILRYGNIIDYLQLDCDPPNITYDILLKIPFDKIKFGVITYEHDYYNDKTKSYREKSREYLNSKGYKLIVGNISPDRNNNPFEDWWIHPDLIDKSIYNYFIYKEVEYINGEDYIVMDNKKEELFVNQKIGINVGAGLGETDYLFNNFDIIYCFEPNDYCFNSLINKLIDNRFKLYNYGISDIDGYSKFNNCEHSGYSSILDFDENSEFYKYCNEIDKGFNNINNITTIKVKRLDTFIEQNNIKKIDLIKIDTQGHDLNVVKSLGDKINIVDTIILECQIKNLYKNSCTKDEIIKYMNSKQFKLVKEESSSEIVADFEQNLTFKKYIQKMKLTILPEITINKQIPTALIIDDFYNNVDEVRSYALSLDYQSEENHGAVGFRCESGRKIYDGTKEYFEHLLNIQIQDDNKEGGWDYSTNGCFQWCPKGTRLVYHCDSQNYAGIVYLTPDAPVKCGTSLLRHKKHKIKDNKIFELDDWHELIVNKKEIFTDKTPWEEVDNFGNIYNRLVLFNSYNVHAVTEYFGDNINNSRLFQLFFFNIK